MEVTNKVTMVPLCNWYNQVAGSSDSTSVQQSSAVSGISLHMDHDHSDISPPKRQHTVSVRQLQSTCDQ